MYDTNGSLSPAAWVAIKAYFAGEMMTDEQISVVRLYLKQWIDSPHWSDGSWSSDLLPVLRAWVNDISSRESIRRWLEAASKIGLVPL